MRPRHSSGSRVAVAALALLTLGSPATGAPHVRGAYHIVLSRTAVGAGERVDLRLEPPPPPGARVHWSFTSSADAPADSRDDGARRDPALARTPGLSTEPSQAATITYAAPLRIPAGTPPVRATATLSTLGARTTTATDITLRPGSVYGTEDCLGPGQSFSTISAGILPEYEPVDDLPSVLTRVDPVYPRSALAQGVDETVVVRALVCRTGRVIDAWAPPRFRAPGMSAVETDPKLEAAAIAAVRQYVFSPGRIAGEPIAVSVDVPVHFQP